MRDVVQDFLIGRTHYITLGHLTLPDCTLLAPVIVPYGEVTTFSGPEKSTFVPLKNFGDVAIVIPKRFLAP